MKDTTVARFWNKVNKTNSCWLWTGATITTNGYGHIRIGNKKVRAHRFSWELHNGPIPKGMMVLHECDTPSCVNPGHLRLGTQADNIRDMISKGRRVYGAAKLDPDKVRDIRLRCGAGESQASLAIEYNVHQKTVKNIVTMKSWKNVT